MSAVGDIIYGGTSGAPTRLAGAAGFLKSTGAVAPSFSALVAADIPSLDAAKITTGRFPLGRMPDGATSGQVLTAQGTGVDPTWAAAAGGAPGGTSGAVQFNSAGVFGGDATNFFWDNTNKRLGIGTATPNNTIQVANLINFDSSIYGTFLGYQAGATTTGNYNTVLGYQALNKNTTGNSNAALGFQALYSNITGVGNTALGYGALFKNTASNNTGLGTGAGYSNTSGIRNTYIGSTSGYYNQTGSNNTIMGYNAGGSGAFAVNSFTDNTIIGDSAGYRLTTGGSNTALGKDALFSNTTGIQNTALGHHAGV
jgi:hypothetical protein